MTIIKDLIQRRVPQILGIYLATSWAIIEFLDWLINRFSISPHLPELGLVILASMIPTVLLLAYFHGKPGRDTWTKIEKIGIPTNVLAAIFLLFFLFRGKDLGAATTKITLENEEGQQIERVIPKSEFRKKIMIFFPENESGDTSLNWLSYGIADMLSTDLIQDYYIEVRDLSNSSSASMEKIKEAGYPNMTGLPLMLEKEMAEEQHMDYFLTGSFTKQDEIYSVNAKLYNTRNGKLIKQNRIVNPNVFDLADQLSIQLKYDLEIPDYHIEEVEDLPISEMTTKSLPAYKWYISGFNEIVFSQNWNKALDDLNKSVQEDSTFSLTYFGLYQLYILTGQSEKAAWIFTPLMNHLYKLPEKLQLFVKASYFEFNQQYEKQYAVFEMLVTLFPEDINSRLTLINIYSVTNRIEEAIAEYKYILKIDPERYSVYKEIGSLYERLGRFEEAIEYYNLYTEHFPDRPESFRSIGSLHKIMGSFEEARSFFEKALLLEPEDIDGLIGLVDIEFESGNYEPALKQYQNILEKCKTPEERAQVYSKLQHYYELRGETKKALEYLYLKQDEWEKTLPPLHQASLKINTFDHYIRMVSKDVAFQTLETLKEELDPLLKKLVYVGYLFLYLELEDIEQAEKSIIEVESLISELKVEVLQRVVLNARGKIHELLGEYDLAVQKYLEQLELEPTNSGIYVNLGRCYRNLKNYNKAEEALQKALAAHPFSPDANYEMALVYYDTGKTEKALEHLKRTISIWENADPDYEPALRAKEKLKEWER